MDHPAPAITKEDLSQALASAPFATVYGFEIASFGVGECSIRVPFQSALERPGGIVSGPAFMAAADVAMWLAIKTRLGLADGSVTVEMKTNFLASAKQEDFSCTARILKCGQRLIYGVAECLSADGKLLTHHTLTYIRHGK